MTIGETFKQARKKMGLDLDEVAAKTKITKNFLEAIEGDELDRLPGEVYARHFLKIYSRLVKIDEDIVISEYHQQYGVKPHSVAHQEQTRRDDADFKRERIRNVMIVTIVVIALVLGTLVVLYFNGTLATMGQQAADRTASALVDEEPPAESEQIEESPDFTPAPVETSVAEEGEPVGIGDAPQDEITTDSDFVVSEEPAEFVNQDAPDDQLETDEDSGADLGFPIVNLNQVRVVGGEAESLDDVFIIGAHENVRVEVFIDGVSRTNRLLRKGDLRAYPFGNYHTVTIYDASHVTIQAGSQVMNIPDRAGAILSLRDWQKGELQDTIDAWSNEIVSEPDAQ